MRSTQCTVICCDNCSSDDSVYQILRWAKIHFDEACSSAAARFILLVNQANAGYAAGNNAAIRYVLEQASYDYIWILNNDTIVKPDALSELLQYARKNTDLGAIGSTMVDWDNPEKVQCAGGYRYWPITTIVKPVWAGKSVTAITVAELASAPRLDYISGAAMLLSVPAIKSVGLLDERFFLYYEEADYALRMRQKGWHLGWCRTSVVFHKGGISTSEPITRSANVSKIPLAAYHENLSTLLFTAKHYPHLFILVALFRLLAKIILLITRRRFSHIKALFWAYKDFFMIKNKTLPQQEKPTVKFSGGLGKSISS